MRTRSDFRQVRLSAFQQELHIVYRFQIRIWCGQVLNARSQAALDIELQTWPQMISREVNFARMAPETAVDQVDIR